jgi:cardiolipin synthase
MLEDTNLYPEPEQTGPVPIQTLPSGPSYATENYQKMALGALHGAQQRVTIVTPYFVPDEALVQAMQLAVLRGVTVDLIVPNHSDKKLMDAVAGSFFDELLQAGVRIHRYMPGLLHAKTLIVDEVLCLFGTSNFDIRSFAINFELSLILYGEQVTTTLRQQHESYLQNSVPLSLEAWRKRPTSDRLLEGVAQLAAPLM